VLRPISHILLVTAPLLALTVGCGGSSSDKAAAQTFQKAAAPFAAPIDFEGGPGSGLWGDTASGPSGARLGCLPGRRYAVAVTLPNRSSSTVTITGVGGAQPAPAIIRRIAVQVRLAPPSPTGDAVGSPALGAWSAASLVPVAIPPRKRAVVQSNFLMGRCGDLGRRQALIVNRAIVVAYRIGKHTGRQTIAAASARIILTRGPTAQRCAPPRGATRLIASDISCAVAVRAALGCRVLPHTTWGSCTATSRQWACTFTNASKSVERCWLASKRQSISVRWH
jgi:hypothetical protein